MNMVDTPTIGTNLLDEVVFISSQEMYTFHLISNIVCVFAQDQNIVCCNIVHIHLYYHYYFKAIT